MPVPASQVKFLQFAQYVVRPTLARLSAATGLKLGGAVAVNLMLGIAAQESGLDYLAQWPLGPARGPFQMEPATLQDLFVNFLAFRPPLQAALLAELVPARDRADQLADNWAFAAAACRLALYRIRDPLPEAPDPASLARYWKAHWNTAQGAGTEAEFAANFAAHIGSPVNG